VNGAAGVTSIAVPGLDTAKTYDISVRRVASATPGSYSSAVPLSSLRWCNSIGHALVRTVDFEIGGARISRLSGEFMDVDAEQTLPSEKESGFNEMVGKYTSYDLYDNSFETRKLYIPLTFAFNKFNALSIPLISLIYHQVNLVFDFREYTELIKSTHPVSSLVSQNGKTPTPDINAFCTFVFLGSQERKKFLETPQEVLLQDIQFVGDAAVVASTSGDLTKKYELSFIHPVSELIWTYNRASSYNSGITPTTTRQLGHRLIRSSRRSCTSTATSATASAVESITDSFNRMGITHAFRPRRFTRTRSRSNRNRLIRPDRSIYRERIRRISKSRLTIRSHSADRMGVSAFTRAHSISSASQAVWVHYYSHRPNLS
jgi:hypothetical protein